MAVPRFGRLAKRSYKSYGFCVKLTAVVILGLCFILVWFLFSPASYSVNSQRETFDDLAEPTSGNANSKIYSSVQSKREESNDSGKGKKEKKVESLEKKENKNVNGSVTAKSGDRHRTHKQVAKVKKRDDKLKIKKGIDKEELVHENEGSEKEDLDLEEEKQEDDVKSEEEEEIVDGEGNGNEEVEGGSDLASSLQLDQEDGDVESDESESGVATTSRKNQKKLDPLFDPKAHYSWKSCSTRSKQSYIPCIDMESSIFKLHTYRHHERSCPRSPVMCLVPLPHNGYGTPVRWPESKLKILYKNVEHPKLAAFIKTQKWVMEAGKYLNFPQNQTALRGGIQHYLQSIEDMVPDIEWGKNIRVVLDIGSLDSSFGDALLEKNVLTLSLGLKDDLHDLAQVSLERGFPTIVSPFANRRLPFPSGVFDAIHCSECTISWHSNGGKLLLEINRILRPGGYFILSSKHNSIQSEEAMSKLTASICWNILTYKSDEVSDIGIKIYKKPESNDIYELRRKKVPPICKEDENPDAAWYTPIKSCLHPIPSSIEERGTEWPEEWPKRLETFPDWINVNQDKLIAESNHWKEIVNNSYLTGLGIDWSNIRNIMDMKAIHGGFAAALSQQKVWVMNVVPVHAPDTLPIIFERGLIGVYHDWCEAFVTYPRSYDLLHADHLFSRLKNRCKQPVVIVVEMDRILRPGGWAIIRDKAEILDPLEQILRSLHWEIRLTFAQDREGILCARKANWRP